MSDKDVIAYFKELDKKSIDWISACPKWQHVRLMSLYDKYLENDTESDYSAEPATPTPAQIQHMRSRYTIVESDITASGAKIKDLKNCSGDVSKMFGVLYSAITKRE